MNITFKFENTPDIAKARVASKLCRASFVYIPLPLSITLQFSDLRKDVYAETPLSSLVEYIIKINDSLNLTEMLAPIAHELIHLSQIHTGRLTISRTGNVIWDGEHYIINMSRMTYKEYRNLPWELDAHNRQEWLLGKVLLHNS